MSFRRAACGMRADTEGVRFFMSNDPLRVFSKIEAVPEACLLTVIVPLRLRDGHEDAIKRLDFALMDCERPREVGFLVVDDGSACPSSLSGVLPVL